MENKNYQKRIDDWMLACFGEEIAYDITERTHRFLEESLELVQSLGCTKAEASQLVDYVYGREIGEPEQEVGGVMTTLHSLGNAAKLDISECGETELERIWLIKDKIKKKRDNKPKFSPLP